MDNGIDSLQRILYGDMGDCPDTWQPNTSEIKLSGFSLSCNNCGKKVNLKK